MTPAEKALLSKGLMLGAVALAAVAEYLSDSQPARAITERKSNARSR